MLSGYYCTTKCLNDGFFLNVDTTTKFIQCITVADRIIELNNNRYSKDEISELLCPKFDEPH